MAEPYAGYSSAPSSLEFQGRKVGDVRTKYEPTMADGEETYETALRCGVHDSLLPVLILFVYRSCESIVRSFLIP